MRWGAIAGWAVDFIRALRERPLWARVLFRLSLGKYAYREFIGLMDDLERDGHSPYFCYGLERMGYHRDEIPLLQWWSERTPVPLKTSSAQPVTQADAALASDADTKTTPGGAA